MSHRGKAPGWTIRRRTTLTACRKDNRSGAGRSLLDQASHGVVGQHQAVELLQHEFQGLAALQGPGSRHMGLDLVVGGLNFPPFVMKRGAFGRRRLLRIKQRGTRVKSSLLSGIR